MRPWFAAWSVAAILAAATTAARAAEEPLKVCLDEDRPPLSVHHKGKPDQASTCCWRRRSRTGSAGR